MSELLKRLCCKLLVQRQSNIVSSRFLNVKCGNGVICHSNASQNALDKSSLILNFLKTRIFAYLHYKIIVNHYVTLTIIPKPSSVRCCDQQRQLVLFD